MLGHRLRGILRRPPSTPQATTRVRWRARRIALDWTLSAEQAALLMRDDPHPFALIGRWAGGGALIGAAPLRVAAPDEDPFALLDEQPTTACSQDDEGIVGGGWFGYLGYELGQRLEPVGPSPPGGAALPPFALAFYDHLLRLDASGRWWFEALEHPHRRAALQARLAALRERCAAGPLRERPFETGRWSERPGAGGHARAVAACRERIRTGDLFQANITQRLSAQLTGEPLDLFLQGTAALRPDRAALVAGPWGALASLSPELFLERHHRRVRSAPIKGTRSHPGDPAAAAAARAALAESTKDRAENVMIVDLVRNDLGRVCIAGSVAVAALAEPRAHSGVWHLVSEVTGTLRGDVGDADLVRAAFPPGSVTGAPKIAAQDVIAELESSPRHAYTGAIGFASPLAGLELSVAIRTFEIAGGHVWLGVGGGVVADSDPVAEVAECATKARPLLQAIGAGLEASPPGAGVGGQPAAAVGGRPRPAVGSPRPPRLAARALPRPDPRRGVFETMRVRAGRIVALELHLERLATSVAALYERPLPAELVPQLASLAAKLGGPARLRLDVRPTGDGLAQELRSSSLPTPGLAVLRPVALAGGLGAHKWADRRLLDALAAHVAPAEVLICDLDGIVLESARASVFLVEADGALATSPSNGALLPGVTRARVIELARALGIEVRVEPIELGRLQRAREIFLTGALRGIEPARCERAVATAPGVVTRRLAALLDRAGPTGSSDIGDSSDGGSATARLPVSLETARAPALPSALS